MSSEFVWCLGEAKATNLAQFSSEPVESGEAYHPRKPDISDKRLDRPAKGRRAHPIKEKVSAEDVLRSFNTWAFKREQPDNPLSMTRTISEAIRRRDPVSFVLYWGKGPRCRVGEPETACLSYLDAFVRRVGQVYAHGGKIKLIFTDTHAELNGHSLHCVQEYFTEVKTCAEAHGFLTCRLSQLVRAAQGVRTTTVDHASVPKEILQHLSASASKWYRGGGSAAEGALKYFQMNMIEKRAVELAFPHSIFVTFNGSDLRCLFPDNLPIFYMYSLRRGISVKPWFLPASGTAESQHADRF